MKQRMEMKIIAKTRTLSRLTLGRVAQLCRPHIFEGVEVDQVPFMFQSNAFFN